MRLTDLTLVLPTRDEARNIGAFLDSIPPDIALIVVDASRDGTPDLIEQHRPRNTLVLREPGTVTEARQRGAELAKTDWLLFTDADVVFTPDYFERLVQLSGAAIYYGPKLSRDRFRRYYAGIARAQAFSQVCGIPAATGSNLVVSRGALMAVGGFDVRLRCNEDSEVVWRLARAGYRVCFCQNLPVYAIDHRRLERGRIGKTFHSFVRCALLYSNLMPPKYRSYDWGYWQNRHG